MELWQIIATGVAIVIIAAAGWLMYQRHRSRHLRERFGSEYDRRVAELGSRRRAEFELANSEARVRKLKVRPLSRSDQTGFLDEWRVCQAQFVDDPERAVNEANRIVVEIMRTRGYAVDDPRDRVADVSAAHPGHAFAYREANEILIRQQNGNASTEDLRKAFINFRSLFDEMLGDQDEDLRRAS